MFCTRWLKLRPFCCGSNKASASEPDGWSEIPVSEPDSWSEIPDSEPDGWSEIPVSELDGWSEIPVSEPFLGNNGSPPDNSSL